MKILNLPAWYPYEDDPLYGLFVKRHIEAVAGQNGTDVAVLFIRAVDDHPVLFETRVAEINDVLTIEVIYRQPAIDIPPFALLTKAFRFRRAARIGFKKYREIKGLPDISHVHILTRMGTVARMLQRRYEIPYVITEHWSRYLAYPGTYTGLLRKRITKYVVKNAAAVLPVTNNLANAMKDHNLKNNNYKVVPNVVDDAIFNLVKWDKTDMKEVIHISTFEDKSKNISGMIRVVHQLQLERKDFIFRLIGDGLDFQKIRNDSEKLGVDPSRIIFEGAKEKLEVARVLGQSHLMLMFSNYENLPVVINEAMACGVPVLATRVGGIDEYLDSDSGILVEAGNEEQLKLKLNDMLDNIHSYDRNKIREKAVMSFSDQAVSNKILSVYKEVLTRND